MFSLFSKSPRSKQSSSGKKHTQQSLVSQRDGIVERKVMEGAERELYQYDQPSQELGMSDLIKNHENGTRFMYAAVTGKESEAMKSKLRRLVSFQPALRKKAIPIDNLPTIKLFKETEVFPLDQIMPQTKKVKEYGDYMRVSDAITMYGAVVSPDCNFTKVNVGITDNRLLRDKTVKSFEATTNMMSKGNLALPYCIPVSDADQLILTISRERAFLEEGRQWGAIQVQLILEFMMFPMQFDNQPVAAMNMVPSTALETPINNPNRIDISILNQDRKKLADLYLDGDLADETEPIENKTQAVKYAKSSISGAQKGKQLQPTSSEWSFLKDKRVGQIDADQNSIEPSVDDISNHSSVRDEVSSAPEIIFGPPLKRPATPPLRSAMKKEVKFDSMSDSTLNSPRSQRNDIKSLTPF